MKQTPLRSALEMLSNNAETHNGILVVRLNDIEAILKVQMLYEREFNEMVWEDGVDAVKEDGLDRNFSDFYSAYEK